MKNSFFLVTPEQQQKPELLVSYGKVAIDQWLSEFPSANHSLSTRLFFDFIDGLNAVEMPSEQRLEVLELLRPHFLTIEDYLRSRLIKAGFPKGEDEQKILTLLVLLEKKYTIGYWIIARELTHRDVSWFKGRNATLAVQRTMKGLSEIVVTNYMMFLPVPDWVWIDLHSLYKLAVKIKKVSTKVSDETSLTGQVTTIENCYKQVLLLSLADPSGLMQKEVRQVFHFSGQIAQYVQIENKTISNQNSQCMILMDEDTKPIFDSIGEEIDSSIMYLNLKELYKELGHPDKYCSEKEARFSSMQLLVKKTNKLPLALFEYVADCWKGIELKGSTFFADRLDRYIALGLDAAHALQSPLETDENLEILAKSFSDRSLSCQFEKEGLISIGSLVSLRKKNEQGGNRCLSIVKKITMPKQDTHIVFELATITPHFFAVTYKNINAESDSEHFKGLLYGVKTDTGEKSFIIIDSFMHKDGDVMRMFVNDKNFPIILGDRKNIGLGYWQFECRQLEEKQTPQQTNTKGYDFI